MHLHELTLANMWLVLHVKLL